MKSELTENLLRWGAVVIMAASVVLSLYTQNYIYLGLLVTLPPLAGLGWRDNTALVLSALIASVVLLFGMLGSDGPRDIAMVVLLILLTGAIAWVVSDYLHHDLMRSHAQRQILEDLDDSLAQLREELETGQAAVTLHQNRQKRYLVLQEAAHNLGTSLDLKEVAKLVVSETSWLLVDKPAGCTLFVFDAKGKEIMREQFTSKEGIPFSDKTEVDADPLNQWVISRRTPLIVKDLARDFRFKGLDIAAIQSKCFLISPLLVEGRVTGVVRIASPEADAFDSEDQRLLESLVSLASLALENAKLFEETEKLAITDGLTKLLLRRPLLERLEEELRRSAERSSKLGCILLDIDHFKSVNDTYGHPAGDEVLRAISGILRQSVREVDLLGRYGGEEFMVLLPETDLEGARLVAERIREAVAARPFRLKDDDKTITVSLGISVYPDAADGMENLIQKADEALYYSKEHGRNRVTSWKDLGEGPKDKGKGKG